MVFSPNKVMPAFLMSLSLKFFLCDAKYKLPHVTTAASLYFDFPILYNFAPALIGAMMKSALLFANSAEIVSAATYV